MRGLMTLVLIVGYPIAEAATLIWFGSTFGWFQLVLLLGALFVAGVVAMRLAGDQAFATLTNANRRAAAFGVQNPDGSEQVVQGPAATPAELQQATRDLGRSSLLFVAGLFLAVPGLISSAIGLVMLIPGVRGWLGRRIAASARQTPSGGVTIIQGDASGFRATTYGSREPSQKSEPNVISGEVLPPQRGPEDRDQP